MLVEKLVEKRSRSLYSFAGYSTFPVRISFEETGLSKKIKFLFSEKPPCEFLALIVMNLHAKKIKKIIVRAVFEKNW